MNNLTPNYKTLTRIPLFRRAVLQSFPFIEENFDALTDYELLCKVVEYLNNVIKQQNLVGENTDELLRVYLELKEYVEHYFDNLDVQDEINNKLDEMASDGTLADLLVNVFTSAQSIARDTLFDSIEEAFSVCLENNYILYLTQDYEIINDTTQLHIPSIIGNGNTIYYDGQGLIGENISINNVNFENNTGSISNGYCLRLENSSIKNSSFKNYVSPLLITGTIKSEVENCNFKNCSQGVFTNDAENVLINSINFINTNDERNYYRTNLQSTEGMDGLLIQNSKNIKIDNSYFEYCVERVLYSSGSNNVTIQNCIVNNSNLFKFVGYETNVSNFNCNNNIVYNAFDDAFVQLYNCENINITNNKFDSENDEKCIGWFLRCGHYVNNVNCSYNNANRIKRSFIDYEDVFPNTIEDTTYKFTNIFVENNIGTRMCLISGNHLPVIYVKDKSSETDITAENLNINNNNFLSRNYDNKSTWSNGNYTNSCLLYCKDGNLINIFNNKIKGIYDSDHKIPMCVLNNSTNIKFDIDVLYETSQPLINFESINGYGIVNLIYTNSDILNGYLKYVFNNNKKTVELNINQHGTIFYKFPKTWDINLNVLNTDEFDNLGIYNQTPIVDGTKCSTTLSNVSGYIYLYDTEDDYITLRTRENRNLSYTGIINIK